MKICEYFRSLQGEGLMMGAPTYFIRTAGCNLHCSWCDTEYAQSGGQETSVEEIMEKLEDVRNVCVTGGEPLLQPDMYELLQRLVDEGKFVVLETNGSRNLEDVPDSQNILISMDIKCPSSGMQDKMMLSNLNVLTMKDQLKFVINDNIDLNYAIRFLREHPVNTNVIFSPVGGMNLQPLAEEVISRKLDVRVLPQLQKIIWGDRNGV